MVGFDDSPAGLSFCAYAIVGTAANSETAITSLGFIGGLRGLLEKLGEPAIQHPGQALGQKARLGL